MFESNVYLTLMNTIIAFSGSAAYDFNLLHFCSSFQNVAMFNQSSQNPETQRNGVLFHYMIQSILFMATCCSVEDKFCQAVTEYLNEVIYFLILFMCDFKLH